MKIQIFLLLIILKSGNANDLKTKPCQELNTK